VRLDMGEPGNAAQALERALELDVTNLVANKLLIEAYLGRGEKERARQRLDLYRLLNDSDPDVADLRRRIDGGRSAAAPTSVADGADDTAGGLADTANTTDTAPDAASDGGREAGDALEEEPMTTGAGPADEWRERETVSGAASSAGGLERRGREGAGGEPFGDLAAGDAERRYLEGLGGEGLFTLPAEALPPETLPEPRPAEIEELTASGAPAAAARPPDERPTVTLGQLYLDQGHFAEARRVFAALLDEEPDHEVARRGLDRAERELAASGPEPVTAAELLREAEPEQPARRALLGAYLARILRSRESRPSDVPR
jgi:tetratricopeptide (TPR) repeat protein